MNCENTLLVDKITDSSGFAEIDGSTAPGVALLSFPYPSRGLLDNNGMKSEIDSKVKEAFDYLEQNAGRLSDSQIDFVSSLRRYHHKVKTLSEKQMNVLFDIKKFINGSGSK